MGRARILLLIPVVTLVAFIGVGLLRALWMRSPEEFILAAWVLAAGAGFFVFIITGDSDA